jgi:hypothetical protein
MDGHREKAKTAEEASNYGKGFALGGSKSGKQLAKPETSGTNHTDLGN